MEVLQELQKQIRERAQRLELIAEPERLWISETGGSILIDFFGSPFGESYEALMAALASPVVAARLGFVSLRGPDDGANGTRHWDISKLFAARTCILASSPLRLSAPH